jgi:hypothetical protein
MVLKLPSLGTRMRTSGGKVALASAVNRLAAAQEVIANESAR